MTRAAPAKKRNRSAHTAISSMAAPTGLPALALSRRPSSSALASSAVGDLEQEQRAVLRGRLLPGLRRPSSAASTARSTSSAELAGTLRDDLVVGRVHDLGRAPVGGVHELAADELLVRLDAFEGVGHGIGLLGVTGSGGKCRHRSPAAEARPAVRAAERGALRP